MSQEKGLILINTGNGKGKSTAAFGLMLRALGNDQKVALIQFMKGELGSGEINAIRKFLPVTDDIHNTSPAPLLCFIPTGTANLIDRDNPSPADLDEAERGMELAAEALKGSYNLVILDEILVAIDFGLIHLEAVLRLLTAKPATSHVLLTGRGAPKRLIEIADMVSNIDDVKHHFYAGISAQRGIEY